MRRATLCLLLFLTRKAVERNTVPHWLLFHKQHGVCWVAMITSAENVAWPGDIQIPKGLDKPSVIRPSKIATLDVQKVEKIGAVSKPVIKKAVRFLRQSLAE